MPKQHDLVLTDTGDLLVTLLSSVVLTDTGDLLVTLLMKETAKGG